MCDYYAPSSGNFAESSVEEECSIRWAHVEFGGRIYLVPLS